MKVQTLQRGLKSRHVSLIALGGIIGSSYFLGTGYILNLIGPGAFVAYILGGIISYIVIACLAELSINVPTTGTFISYASHYISPTWACGVGWSYWMSWVIYIPSECIAAGIIMNHYLPGVHEYIWAALFGIIITLFNIVKVKFFGEAEFWLAMIKIILLVGFSILAILIFMGLIGNKTTESIGGAFLWKDGGLFPNGYLILLINMVILLSNYQGSEIIGISASETHNPKKEIPKTLEKISFRILGLYIIPTFLVALIMPWQKANMQGSVFAQALNYYGLVHIAHIFNFFIIAGALSSANSGLYATIRSLYALSQKNMAPKALSHLSRQGVPFKATLLTMATVWMVLLASYFFSTSSVYANLLGISGFTGAICWISICWSQLNFRKRIESKGISLQKLSYKTPGFPIFSHVGIWLQVLCLLVVALSPKLRPTFYLGIPAVILPMIFYNRYKLHHKFFSLFIKNS
jgi:AAT family amino acid transporter